MRVSTLSFSAPAFALLAGCVAVPYYPPVPVARMTPQQSAATVRPLDPAERERLAKLNADVQREQDAADAEEQRIAALSQSYAYGYPMYGGYYGYPAYYPGYYPFWPGGVSLSFGYVYRGGWGHRGWGGRGWGGRGWGGHGWAGGRGGGGWGHHR